MDLAEEIYSREFNPAAGMTLFIASNLDETTIKEYVRKYIATIPTDGKTFTKAKLGNAYRHSRVRRYIQ